MAGSVGELLAEGIQDDVINFTKDKLPGLLRSFAVCRDLRPRYIHDPRTSLQPRGRTCNCPGATRRYTSSAHTAHDSRLNIVGKRRTTYSIPRYRTRHRTTRRQRSGTPAFTNIGITEYQFFGPVTNK